MRLFTALGLATMISLTACSEAESEDNPDNPNFYIDVVSARPETLRGPFGTSRRGCVFDLSAYVSTSLDAFELTEIQLFWDDDIPAKEAASFGILNLKNSNRKVTIGAIPTRLRLPVVGDCRYYKQSPNSATFNGVQNGDEWFSYGFDVILKDNRGN